MKSVALRRAALQTGGDYEQDYGSNIGGMGTVTATRAGLTHGKRGKR
jgi:hypothetical protein